MVTLVPPGPEFQWIVERLEDWERREFAVTRVMRNAPEQVETSPSVCWDPCRDACYPKVTQKVSV